MKAAVIIGCGALLAACAGKDLPPKISYDSEDFTPAVRPGDPPRPVEIVTVPEPLPLPGQLKPAPDRLIKSPEPEESPEERIDEANAAARMEPDAEGYINAIQVYPFVEGALYRLYAAPGQVSVIRLQAGEKLVSVSAGDTLRWIVGDVVSGAGAEARSHLLVKPIKAGLRSNLAIITDRRAYHVELESTAETYMASVSWTYPQDELIALRRQQDKVETAAAQIIETGLDLATLRFRYEVAGDHPPWRPLRAFDDGTKVYIQFPSGIGQGEAPPLFVVGRQGEAQLVNYRVRGRYYIVDRLFAAAELRLGEEPQQIVRITRTDGRARTSQGGR